MVLNDLHENKWPRCERAPNPRLVPFHVQVEHSVDWLVTMHGMNMNNDLISRDIYTPYHLFLGREHIHPAKNQLLAAFKQWKIGVGYR